jgi:peptide/nickel transport system substrate-binding protein
MARFWLRNRQALFMAALALVMLVLPLGVQAQTPVRGGSLVIGLQADLGQLDPHKSAATITYVALSPIFQSLVDLGPNLEIRPLLATSWTVSSDGLTWTFNLRRGVLFHNGRELTSADVKFNVERIIDPKTGARGRGQLSVIESVATPEKYVVQFRLRSKFGVFPTTLVTTFQAIAAPESFDPATNMIKSPIGTGPFQFVEWRTNDRLVMRRFDKYWEQGKPYLDEVVLKPIPDDTVRLTALQTGDITMALDMPVARLRDLFASPSKDYVIRLVKGGTGYGVIVLMTTRKPLDNKKVRQAMAYAVNKRELIEAQFRGWGREVNQKFPKGHPWHVDVRDRPMDLDRARQLLIEAGLPNGFRTTMTVPNAYSRDIVGQVFQAQMRRIGIEVDLQVFDFPTWVKRADGRDFDITNTTFFPKVDPDDAYFRYLHTDGTVWQLSGLLRNGELDRLLDEGRAEADTKKRVTIYKRVVEIMNDEASMLIYGQGDASIGWRSNVRGFVPQTIGALSYPGGGLQHVWLAK